MFYEIKELKPSYTRWWLGAAFSVVIVTAMFVAATFWISINPDHPSTYLERRTAYDEFDFKSDLSKDDDQYQNLEILNIKNKAGRIEMVEINNEKFKKVVTTEKSNLDIITESSFDPLEIVNDDHLMSIPSSVAPETVEVRTHSSIPNDKKFHKHQLQDGISPIDESSEIYKMPNVEVSPIKKKSEAVPPSWHDSNLQPTTFKHVPMDVNLETTNKFVPLRREPIKIEPTESEKIVEPVVKKEKIVEHKEPIRVESTRIESTNFPKVDKVYDISDFSSIKPDLSAFNLKTIPAFTYLKGTVPKIDAEVQDEHEEPSGDAADYYYQQLPKDNPPETHKPFSGHDNPVLTFIQRRFHDIKKWIFSAAGQNKSTEITDLLKSINETFQTKNVGSIFNKFRQIYLNSSDFENTPVSNLLYPKSSVLNDSSSLVSFGLLAIDVFLLHNVQQIVWNEHTKVAEEMLRDPDVLALNSLFLPPDKIMKLRQRDSRVFTEKENTGVVHELLEFLNGGLRAVLNLSKAYKSSKLNKNLRSDTGSATGSTLDCIWTLYCRNLDKTAKLEGPYGFLAKMNSLGLRLMMGEFPVSRAWDHLTKEYANEAEKLNCQKLFPRCSAEEAKEVVIQTALGKM